MRRCASTQARSTSRLLVSCTGSAGSALLGLRQKVAARKFGEREEWYPISRRDPLVGRGAGDGERV